MTENKYVINVINHKMLFLIVDRWLEIKWLIFKNNFFLHIVYILLTKIYMFFKMYQSFTAEKFVKVQIWQLNFRFQKCVSEE